jgi:hypothetical protein
LRHDVHQDPTGDDFRTTTHHPLAAFALRRQRGFMPVIVLGMHRSGTSMVTRLLQACGVYLGEANDLLLPDSEDNPEGYWEHRDISKLNEEILEHLGGSWREPPQVESGWSTSASLQSVWERFESIAADLKSHPKWGWKDPRNSLTLEFWLMHMPDLQLVLCLRNPLEVADSLSTGKPMRDMDRAAALGLWVAYHRVILQQDIADSLIVTHYDSYMYDPDAELQRVLAALDVQASDEQIQAAIGTIRRDLKHQHMPEEFLWDETERNDVRRIYDKLCLLAGDVFEKRRVDSAFNLKTVVSYATTLRKAVTPLQEMVAQQTQKSADDYQYIKRQQHWLTERGRLIEQQRQWLLERDRLIEQHRQTFIKRDRLIAEQRAMLAGYESQLAILAPIALDGYQYRDLQRSTIMRAIRKLRNAWRIRRVTAAIRTGQLRIPALFDAQWYVEQYPDVRAAGMHPYAHFWLFGWHQSYQPMPLFDVRWYVTNYPYFNDAGINPLEHYESVGHRIGCRPSEQFDPQRYLAHYADVREAGMEPLYHYYIAGSKEGRHPSPASENMSGHDCIQVRR